MDKRDVKVPEFEAQTGIPKDRVYKWLKRMTSKIDHADAALIETWIGGQLSKADTSLDELIRANNTLADANKRLAEAHVILSETNKELMLMAKEAFNYRKSELIEQGQPGKETGTKAALDELRQTGRTGPFSQAKSNKPQGSSKKEGK